MPRSEIEQDVGGLPDHELAGFQKRRGEWRRAAARLHHLHHPGHAALAARHIDIVGAGLFQREADIFTAALNARPVIEFVAHWKTPYCARAFYSQNRFGAMRAHRESSD